MLGGGGARGFQRGGLLGGLGRASTGAAFSFATTYALGQVARRYYAGGRTIDAAGLQQAFAGLLGEAKQILLSAGVPTPKGAMVGRHGDGAVPSVPLPVVVKPRGEGSSNGVSIVRDPAALEGAIALACRYDTDAIVEEYVPGREVTVAVLDGCRTTGDGRRTTVACAGRAPPKR